MPNGLDEVGVLAVELVDADGIFAVELVVRRQEHKAGALPARLPDRLRRLDAEALGGLVLREDNPVARGRVAAHGHWHIAQIRVAQQLHRGKKAVLVTVQNHPLHASHLPSKINHMFHYSTVFAHCIEKPLF